MKQADMRHDLSIVCVFVTFVQRTQNA